MNTFRAIALLFVSLSAQAAPCPDIDIEPNDVDLHAEWIIEGTISQIRQTGTFRDCEMLPWAPGGVVCSDVNKPEVLVLNDVIILRDQTSRFGTEDTVEISRASHCFSGPLSSIMNRKPELDASGRKLRFYGRDDILHPIMQPGYFWVESIE